MTAGRITVIGNGQLESTAFTECFDIFSMNLNGTTPHTFLMKWVTNRANLSLVVGLYDSCYSCELLLGRFADSQYEEFQNAAIYMLKIFYYVYKPTGKLLPVMVHCDNDFETMALKHSVAFDLSDTPGRRLEVTEENKCGCPFAPSFLDVSDASWAETRKSSGTFLKTLYRFAEVLSGKDVIRANTGLGNAKLSKFNPNDAKNGNAQRNID